MAFDYDPENIFARILRGEIPNSTVLETEHSLAFNDIAPQAPTHILVIPKGAYTCYDHFAQDATEAEIVDFTRTVGRICKDLGVSPGTGGSGYRVISNAGPDSLQEVPHLHFHILAGRGLGPLLA